MRKLDLDALQIFKAVVDFGSVTNAASQLNRVQSNITTRVKNLEQRLGVMLFTQHGGKLIPSSEGRLLYQYAECFVGATARVAHPQVRSREGTQTGDDGAARLRFCYSISGLSGRYVRSSTVPGAPIGDAAEFDESSLYDAGRSFVDCEV